MGRKVIAFCVIALVLVSGLTTQALAATHTVYDNGNISTTYLTYFEDIISGIGLQDNYVAFRSGQYEHCLVVGDLEYKGGVISLIDEGKIYRFTQEGNYNSTYKYYHESIDNFSLNTNDYIIYSDVGDYPQLVERGAQYEILTTIILSIGLLCVVISRIFRFR